MEIFAAHNPDSEIRRQSSAGGVFTMLAEKILSEGGVVYGVAFDDEWNIVHRRVDNKEDLKYLRGSKYAYSRIGTSIQDAKNDLYNGLKVLFSGTPCQAAAMRKFAGDNQNLIIVEVVCHSAPEQKYWRDYLHELCEQNNKDIDEIIAINFRDKSMGWKDYGLSIKFSDGSHFHESHNTNVYMQAFLKDLTIRDACFKCNFKYPSGSKADLTLGDFWGISKLAPEIDNDEGTTIVIARTEIGASAIKGLDRTTSKQFEISELTPFNPAITNAVPANKKRNRFVNDTEENIIQRMCLYTKHHWSDSYTKIISRAISKAGRIINNLRK